MMAPGVTECIAMLSNCASVIGCGTLRSMNDAINANRYACNRHVSKPTEVNSTHSTGYSVHPVDDNTWGETTLNNNNKPTIGTPIGSSGAVTTVQRRMPTLPSSSVASRSA